MHCASCPRRRGPRWRVCLASSPSAAHRSFLLDWPIARPLVIGIVAGLLAQAFKLFTFLVLEKRINFRRLVETDGAPNMHSAAFAGLTTAIAQVDGVQSLEFALAASLTALVTVDIWNVKHAASRQADVVDLIVRKLRPDFQGAARRSLSYTVLDVLAGTAVGVALAWVIR
ncbi:MAG TPA: divergent PAP2 family protein [Candidatus Krumholzibacteria bacterium]|nr:divergent PAP2 family protein [Candidatus Krumholzibacteria bacterium]